MRKKRSTFRRSQRHGGTNTAAKAYWSFQAWKQRYGGKHPPITRDHLRVAHG